MAALVDTNVLVYRIDERDRRKQRIATKLLLAGVEDGTLCLAHQCLVEFVAAATQATSSGPPLLLQSEAWREVETLMSTFRVLLPSNELVRTALRGASAYGMSWFDAHMWAYAEHHGIPELITEDFQHGRRYGSVRVTNPFA